MRSRSYWRSRRRRKSFPSDLGVVPEKESTLRDGFHVALRGTRVELQCSNMVFANTSGSSIDSTRVINLNVVNQRGSENIPLHAGFLGDNGIINDGTTDNSLSLRLSNTVAYDGSHPERSKLIFSADPEQPSRIILSFDTGSSEVDGALGEASDIETIQVTPLATGWIVEPPSSGSSHPKWTLYPNFAVGDSQVLQGRNYTEITGSSDFANFIDIALNGIVTASPTGITHLHIHYENIPGYWDGQMKLEVDMRPLKYANKYVGIGTPDPQALLHVDGDIIAQSVLSTPYDWHEKEKLRDSSPDVVDNFGISVSIHNNFAIVGVPGEDQAKGKACIYFLKRQK